MDDYSEILRKNKEDLHALHNRAICFQKMGELKKAIRDFSKILEINSKNANALFNRGFCFDR